MIDIEYFCTVNLGNKHQLIIFRNFHTLHLRVIRYSPWPVISLAASVYLILLIQSFLGDRCHSQSLPDFSALAHSEARPISSTTKWGIRRFWAGGSEHAVETIAASNGTRHIFRRHEVDFLK